MSKLEIMVIDDQPTICKEVAAYLKNDYVVHAFKSGKEAISFFDKEQAISLILLDYHMPEMTGFETLLNFRRRKDLYQIPVVFLTAETSDRMELEMKQRGAVDYLVKPINATDLRRCISKHIKK